MITYETDGERLADETACAGVRADLKMCLLQSDCCRIVRKLLIFRWINVLTVMILGQEDPARMFETRKRTHRMPGSEEHIFRMQKIIGMMSKQKKLI